MPVDRETFMAVRQKVIQTAPPGLSREQFNALLDQEVAKAGAPPPPQHSTAAIPLAAAAAAVPTAARIATEVATNPAVPKIGSAIGKVIGGVAPVLGGGAKFGPAGAAMGVAGISKGVWAGGNTGYWTGRLAQKLAAPIATGLTAMEPYAAVASKALTPMALYQTAEQLGPSNERTDNPALINDFVIPKIAAAIEKTKSLISSGASHSKAAMEASGGNPALFAAILGHFMKSGGVK